MPQPNLRRHHPLERLAHLSMSAREKALAHPILGDLVVVYGGYFPQAKGHCIDRPKGYDSHQLALVEAGRGVLHMGRRRINLGPGDLFFARGDGPIFYRADEVDPWSLRWVHFTGRRAPALLDSGAFARQHPVRHLAGGAREQITALLNQAISFLEIGQASPNILSAAETLRRLFLQLGSDTGAAGPSDFTHRLYETLGPDCSQTIKVTEWAHRMGISPTQFRVRVRGATGESPLGLLTRLRLERGRDLIRFRGLPVAEAAAQSGFPDSFYFSRRYRQFFGRSPRQDRNQFSL